MDEGSPIAYQVLHEGVPVYSSDREQVGTVEHVIAALAQDIFHGVVIATDSGPRFIAADDVAAIHERGVDLRITAAEAHTLPEPGGAAPAWRVREPGVRPGRWRHLLDELEGVAPTRRDWTSEE